MLVKGNRLLSVSNSEIINGTIIIPENIEIIEDNLGNIDELLKSGKIKVITNYLIDNIYVNGAAFTGREVLEKLGKSNLSVEPLVNYFYKKYGNENY